VKLRQLIANSLFRLGTWELMLELLVLTFIEISLLIYETTFKNSSLVGFNR